MALQVNKKIDVVYHLSTPYYMDVSKIIDKLEDTLTVPIVIENAYIKIISIDGNKEKINMDVAVYTSSEKLNMVSTKTYSFKPNMSYNSSNFIKQGYEFLKTLDEYSEAIDLLDEGQSL